MPIPVTTRSGKGSVLTQTEMDNNFTDLSRDASRSAVGNVRLATANENAAGTSTSVAMTPSAFTEGSQQVLSTEGKQVLPGGLILQWFEVSSTTDAAQSYTFPTAFPNECVFCSVSGSSGNISNAPGNAVYNLTASGFDYNRFDTFDGSADLKVFAIGY